MAIRMSTSVRQFDRADLGIDIAGTGIVRMGATAEMPRDTPDRVQRGLHGALHPGRGPGDVVTRKEDSTLIGWQVVLHEMGVHPAVVSVVPGKRALERAEGMLIGL